MPAAPWVCGECECECTEEEEVCPGCDAPCPESKGDDAQDRYSGYKVCKIMTVDLLKAPLKKLQVAVCSEGEAGDEGKLLTVVTNAPNVVAGKRSVVATEGAVVDQNGEDIVIKRTQVGGVISQGMMCDSKMLGWTGGGAGVAVTMPESFALGAAPPAQMPRGDGK